MQKRFWPAALVAVLLLCGSTARAEDNFYVIGGGAAPGVGTKITSVPYTIFTPGFYYLDRNLVYSGNGDAITIAAYDVTLDLMGFSLTYTGAHDVSNGIFMDGCKNVEIRNGSISGFFTGVYEVSFSYGANHRVLNIRADNNTLVHGIGIFLDGNNHLVRDCTASNNYETGIFVRSGTITGCVACDNGKVAGGYGFHLIGPGSLLENVATNTTTSNTIGFNIGSSTNTILMDGNSAGGNGINYTDGGTGTVWGVNAGR